MKILETYIAPSIEIYDINLVQNILADGSTRDFEPIPGEYSPSNDITDTFDLYGVYGGGGLSTVPGEEDIALLPDTPWSGATLTDIQKRGIIVLTFEKKGVRRVSPDMSVVFRHVGSLFMIQLKNTGSGSLNNIREANLTASTPIWAHKNTDIAKYNIVTGEFIEGTTISDNDLPFHRLPANLASGGVLSFWGWYPLVKEKMWPIMNMKVNVNGRDFKTTVPKGPRIPSAGKAYYFYLTLDGAALSFADRANASPSKYILADERDGNVYSLVINSSYAGTYFSLIEKADGNSVRCVRDF